jgi:transposase
VLRALLLQAFYSVRSERQLVEQLDYNLLFRWPYRVVHAQAHEP